MDQQKWLERLVDPLDPVIPVPDKKGDRAIAVDLDGHRPPDPARYDLVEIDAGLHKTLLKNLTTYLPPLRLQERTRKKNGREANPHLPLHCGFGGKNRPASCPFRPLS